MDDNHEPDESRMLHGSGALAVYIPPKPPPKPEDITKDFPPGYPPEVHYYGVTANYWVVLREGRMAYLSGTKVFSDEQMQWLRSIKGDVEALIRKMP